MSLMICSLKRKLKIKNNWLKKNLLLLTLLLFSQYLFSQKIDCKNAVLFLDKKEQQIEEINTTDPEFIPLHNLLLNDIKKELEKFNTEFIPQLTDCQSLNYYDVVSRYDQVAYRYRLKADNMAKVAHKVDSLFYEAARFQLLFENKDQVIYLLNRSLQYNRIYPEALILKCEILFEKDDFEQCLEILHLLYYEADLSEIHENQLIRFTMRFYDKLYQTADSLVKTELASDALYLFKILEQFCVNMPTTYCNDDYYHGILRSKKGVYDSYILIASVAKERGSPEIEEKFLLYAEQYRLENEKDIADSKNAKELPDESHLQIPENEIIAFNLHKQDEEYGKLELPQDNSQNVSNDTIDNSLYNRELNANSIIEKESAIGEGKEEKISENAEELVNLSMRIDTLDEIDHNTENQLNIEFENANITLVDETMINSMTENQKDEDTINGAQKTEQILTAERIYSPENIKEMEIEYNRLFVDAVSQCLDNNFSEAYKTLKRALELESCSCFEIDPRIQILYNTIADTR